MLDLAINPSLWVGSIKQRFARIPAWVTVLVTAAVVGSISAMLSVTALARVKNSKSRPEMPVSSNSND
jgi:hypothetical protein